MGKGRLKVRVKENHILLGYRGGEAETSVNRRVNCDAANLDKAVEAAMSQVEAIRWLEQEGKLITLPEKLREAAALRIAHPEDTLAQLAERCDPPVTKSALNHRLRKLMELGESGRRK